jgi:hypothetical protein
MLRNPSLVLCLALAGLAVGCTNAPTVLDDLPIPIFR